MPDTSPRLTSSHWTDLGLKTLEEEGFTALRADKLARKLGVSRGSFYWHFADIAAFEKAVLDRWRELVLAALDSPLTRSIPPVERLRTLMRRSMLSQRRVEIAVRAWSTARADLRLALDRIDERRIAYMCDLVEQCGTGPDTALPVAQIIYWTYLGHAVAEHRPEAEVDAVVDRLVALAQG